MTFPSKAFLYTVISVLTFGLVTFATVILLQAHTIAHQRELLIEIFNYIVAGCPITQ
jgi:hypothetical protein